MRAQRLSVDMRNTRQSKAKQNKIMKQMADTVAFSVMPETYQATYTHTHTGLGFRTAAQMVNGSQRGSGEDLPLVTV